MIARPEKRSIGLDYARADERTLASVIPLRPARPELVLSVHAGFAGLRSEWEAFEKSAAATLFQCYLWCCAWQETAGAARGVQPRIVIARDQAGNIQFILPLQLRSSCGLRILEWHGTPNTNYGYGLYSRNFLPGAEGWFSRHGAELLRLAGPADALTLADMPESLFGHPHPLRGLFTMRGANRSYAMMLQPDYEKFYAAKRSKQSRRTVAKKDRALGRAGQLHFGLPQGKDATRKLLDVMFDHQQGRLAEHGVHGVFGEAERRFVHRLAELQDESAPLLLPYFLSCDGEVLSVMLGGSFGGTYWALISSLAPTALRKHSPGDLALRNTIAATCKAGLARFDFAAGDSSYKLHWAEDVLQLHATFKAFNLRGLAWVCAMAPATMLKRLVKQNPALRALALNLRRRFAGTGRTVACHQASGGGRGGIGGGDTDHLH